MLHGTTIATNALLEHDGARVGHDHDARATATSCTSARHQRPQHYSIMQEIPWQDRPLSRRRHRKVVTERIVPPAGEVLRPARRGRGRAGRRGAARGGRRGDRRLLPLHLPQPRARGARARRSCSRSCPDVVRDHLGASVFPQFREFERFTTAAINAFVGPQGARLPRPPRRRAARRRACPPSSASCAPTAASRRREVAAKPGDAPALAARRRACSAAPAPGERSGRREPDHLRRRRHERRHRHRHARAGSPRRARATRGSPAIPVMVPMIDIHTIGAGGGCIAYVDAGGAFRVGPRSAGAEPGPACYGRGGAEPTVTDANVVLGRLRPGALPRRRDGARRRRRDRARSSALGERLGLGLRGGRRGRDHARQPATWRRHPLAHGPEGPRPARSSRSSPSAARARCTPPRSRARSAMPEVLVPPYPGHHVGDRACSPPTSIRPASQTQFMLSGDARLRAARRRPRRASKRRCREQLAADGVRARTRSASSARPTAATSARATSCGVADAGRRARRGRARGALARLPRAATAPSTATSSRTTRSRSSTCASSGIGRDAQGDRRSRCRGERHARGRAIAARRGGRLPRTASGCRDGVLRARRGCRVGEPVEGPAVILQADTTTSAAAPGRAPSSTTPATCCITLEEGMSAAAHTAAAARGSIP